jgi:hypothetical protein
MAERPDVPEPPAHRNPSGRFTTFLWVFFLLVVVYPLSIGPVAWLHLKVPTSRPAIEAFYTPITLLVDHSEQFAGFMRWYILKVWRIPVGK